jgi:Domain of unknown function (DUF1816)
MNIQDILSNTLNLVGKAWWVEVSTDRPHCLYYFGPFATTAEANTAQSGYVEDLERESATGIQVAIKRCKPAKMTIDYDDASPDFDYCPIL